MEFNHTIIKVLDRRAHIIQVKTVILIALLALARKFIILDPESTDAATITAIGIAVLVLGIVHWFLCRRDYTEEFSGESPMGEIEKKKNSNEKDH